MIMDFDYIKNKSAFIVDVDGTLYTMSKMHAKMVKKLFSYYFTHPYKLRELLSVYYFRKLRSSEEFKHLSVDECIETVAHRLKMRQSKAIECVDYWMFEYPLNIINDCKYSEIVGFLNKMHADGKKVFVYSDYPAEEKIKRLNLKYDGIFTADDDCIKERKPSRKAMEFIIGNTGFSQEEYIYIGDREELDGKSAELINIDYCDVKELISIIGGHNGF